MNEKPWRVSFVVLFNDDGNDEYPEEIFTARTIDGALRLANQRLMEFYKRPGVRRAAVWKVELDVF